MASANFETCLNAVLRHEGGYADHPADPGGATHYGITRTTLGRWRGRAVSKAEVQALSRLEAARIYRVFYWDEVAGDELPDGLDLAVFDYGVNSGPGRSIRTLQKALNVKPDGRLGPLTLAAISQCESRALISSLCRSRLGFLERLRSFSVFGRGWTRRVSDIESLALAMAEHAAARVSISTTEEYRQ